MSFQHILFPVDFSEQSRRAAPFVQAMAARFGSEVSMLYVLDLPPAWFTSPEAVEWASQFDVEELRRERCTELNEFLAGEFCGMKLQRVMAEGEAGRQIVCQAKALASDLIMMPTHGYGPYRSLLLGSVTAKVLHDAECPVWTGVHAPEFTAHQPGRLQRILCAVDIDAKEVRVIRWAEELGREQGAEVRLIHAIPGESNGYEHSEKVYREFLCQISGERIEKLQAEAGTKFGLTLRFGKPGHVVHEAARDQDADLVVVGRGAIQKPLGRLRSTAYAIIRESPCPVISI